jgi:hypothetical protein
VSGIPIPKRRRGNASFWRSVERFEHDREHELGQQEHGVLVESELGEPEAHRDEHERCREDRPFKPARNEAEGEHDGGK